MPTLRDLRRATADRVAPFELATSGVLEVGQSGARDVYVGTALDQSRRRIVTSDLVSVDVLGQGPENPGDYLKNDWVYLLTDPPQQRRVPEGGFVGFARVDEAVSGYTPALTPHETPVAFIDVERPFLGLVAAGTELEIHAIPPERGGRSAGLHDHIRKALRVILREDTISVPGASGQTSLDVTASFPWITNPNTFVAAHYVETTAGMETWGVPGAMLRFDGERVLMSPNITSAGQSQPVRVLRPLSSYVKPALSSAWVESSTGPVDEDDQVLGDPDAISLIAAFHVAEEQANLCPVGSAEALWWMGRAQAFSSRSVFLRDQRARRSRYEGQPWPDFVSVDGPYRGRYGPGFR